MQEVHQTRSEINSDALEAARLLRGRVVGN
jgi:hypothetical protein